MLYADNELSAGDKVEVELFIKENADLEEELLMLRQAVLKPDNSIMMDKSGLRKEEAFINSNNYEERFIEYHDEELNEDEESEVMKFIGANKLQDEFALFAQVKMQPEQIPFPAKYSLYRKEDDEKVIPFRWWMAAAAILIGVGLWMGGSFVINRNNKGMDSKFTASIPPSFSSLIAKHQLPAQQKDKQKVSPVVILRQPPDPNPVNKNNSLVKNEVKENKPEIINKSNQDRVIVQAPIKNNDEKDDQKLIVDVPRLDPSKAITDPTVDPKTKIENVTPVQENGIARLASYVPEEEVKSENYAFFNITSEEFKKSKLGSFLRTVKRVIGRKIPFHNEKTKPEVAIN